MAYPAWDGLVINVLRQVRPASVKANVNTPPVDQARIDEGKTMAVASRSISQPFFPKRTKAMPYYRFHQSDGSAVAITDDRSGAKLPNISSVWKADGLTEVVIGGRKRFGVEPAEIIYSIEREGFYIGSLQGK